MESMDSEYSFYWETKMFLENQELDSWAFGESIPGLLDHQSSPDGSGTSSSTSPTAMGPPVSAAVAKNIVMERERRRRLNERLYALRSVVPNITRMDKVSIVKDAITYIQELQEQERRLSAEVEEASKPVTAMVGSKQADQECWCYCYNQSASISHRCHGDKGERDGKQHVVREYHVQ